jgi:hypothetical protein
VRLDFDRMAHHVFTLLVVAASEGVGPDSVLYDGIGVVGGACRG